MRYGGGGGGEEGGKRGGKGGEGGEKRLIQARSLPPPKDRVPLSPCFPYTILIFLSLL